METPMADQLLMDHRYLTVTLISMAAVTASTFYRLYFYSWMELSLIHFLTELLGTFTNAFITVHFLGLMVHYLIIGVSQAWFGALRPSEREQSMETIIRVGVRCLLVVNAAGREEEFIWISLMLWFISFACPLGLLSVTHRKFTRLMTLPSSSPRDIHRVILAVTYLAAADTCILYLLSHIPNFPPMLLQFGYCEAALFVFQALDLATKIVFHVWDVGSSVDAGALTIEYYLLCVETVLSSAHLLLLIVYDYLIISSRHFRTSLTDLTLILQLKDAIRDLGGKIKRLRKYHQVASDLDHLFPDATKDDLSLFADDVCVICLQSMDEAKKLNCGHLFHRLCLRQCLQRVSAVDALLEQNARRENGDADQSTLASSFRCPICRSPVGKKQETLAVTEGGNDGEEAPVANDNRNDDSEAVIRLSTAFLSRFLPLPTVSFEILRHRRATPTGTMTNNRFEVSPEMLQRVWEMFPQHNIEDVRLDLERTRSAEMTIERILGGQLDAERQEEMGMGGPGEGIAWSLSQLWSGFIEAARPPHPHQL